MNNFFKFSQFFSWKKKNKQIVIFHRLHPSPFYLKQKNWNTFLIKKGKNLINQFEKQNLIINSNKQDLDNFKRIAKNFKKNFNYISTLYLVLTRKCNLKCKYCPFSKLLKEKNILMSSEVAIKGIDLFSKHIYKNFNKKRSYFIIFYGGEPLLNIDTLKYSLKYIEKLKKESRLPKDNLHIIIDTNGILINNKIIKLFKKHNVMVTVGCDGSKKINDYYRIDKNGKGTFQKVIKVIKILKKNKIKIFISTSITPYNILKINDFSNFFLKYKIDKFGFNILRGKLSVFLNCKINLEKYYVEAANEIINNFHKEKNKKYEYQMEKRLDLSIKNNFSLLIVAVMEIN